MRNFEMQIAPGSLDFSRLGDCHYYIISKFIVCVLCTGGMVGVCGGGCGERGVRGTFYVNSIVSNSPLLTNSKIPKL